MFVCLTTENFPDVMLEVTAINTAYAIFFVIFILFGVWFLMSVLLAVIFDNYKHRLQTLQKANVTKRIEYIDTIFATYDKQNMGWLTMKQTRRFFSAVLELNMSDSKHRKILR